MSYLIHRSPSVGSLVKKVLAINPELGTQEIIQLIRQSMRTQGEAAGEYASLEVVDEDKALALARATIARDKRAV